MNDDEEVRLREEIRAATRKYLRTKRAHEEAHAALIDAIVNGMRNGVRPAQVEEDAPFKGPYIRRIREQHGIPAFKKGQPAPPASESE